MELTTGSAESTLDDKGRVSIPVRFREQYQGELIITCGFESCAWIMTPAVWEHFKKNILNSDMLTQEERDGLKYKHLYEAHKVDLDKAGRIAIPPPIRKYANLSKDCRVIKTEDRLDIWDSGVYETYRAEKDAMVRAAFNKLGSKNIFRAETTASEA